MAKKRRANSCGKVGKSINFDYSVLKKIEQRVNEESTTVSNFVNSCMRKVVMNDKEYYKYLAKKHNALFYHYKAMSEGIL